MLTSTPDEQPTRRLALDEIPGVLNESNTSIIVSDASDTTSHEEEEEEVNAPAHPAGITLTRQGYYTVPSLDDLATMADENGSCVVANFTVGRENYGNIFFDKPFDVSGLNLDDLAHIRHREVVVYPNDEKKPPLGEGLNRPAQVTLDRVYPRDKTTRQYITDSDILKEMNYEGTLRKSCAKMGTQFIEYRPDTGSYVFKVPHFSKYGLEEDSEDEQAQPGAKKICMGPGQPGYVQQPPVKSQAIPAKTPHQSLQLMQRHTSTENADDEQEMEFYDAKSPTEHLSLHTGADVSKMRLMKASLFTLEDSCDKVLEARDDSVEMREPTLPVIETLKIRSQSPVFKVSDLLKSKLDRVPQEEPPKEEKTLFHYRPLLYPSVVTPHTRAVPSHIDIDYCKSITDAALDHGNCGRPSWGPNGTLVFPFDASVAINAVYQSGSNFPHWVDRHLTIQLRHTLVNENGTVPQRYPRSGIEALHEHCKILENIDDQDDRDCVVREVLELCMALWGEIGSLPDAPNPALVSFRRRELVCDWLQRAMSKNDEQPQMKKGLSKVFHSLVHGDVREASQYSQSMGDHYSALLLATAGSPMFPRQMVLTQLQEWVQDEVTSLVEDERLRCWLMAGAGIPVLPIENGDILNVLHELNWLECLAVHFWYLCSPASSVPDVLHKYEQAFSSSVCYATSPVPAEGTEENLDIRFHLLKLFSQRSYSLEPLFSVESHSPSTPLNFGLSWLLLVLLDALNYTHVSEHCSQSLHLAFSEQLEAAGLWHWAIFVLQHITNPSMRHSGIEQILIKHVSPTQEELTETESFIVHKLGIPETMVYEAKVCLALSQYKYREAACFQLRANNWQECHQTIVDHLAEDAIINGSPDLLLRVLTSLQPHMKEITNWSSYGQVYYNYLTIVKEINKLQKLEDIDDAAINVEAMKLSLAAVFNSVAQLPLNTPKNILCRTEMINHIHALQELLQVQDSADEVRSNSSLS